MSPTSPLRGWQRFEGSEGVCLWLSSRKNIAGRGNKGKRPELRMNLVQGRYHRRSWWLEQSEHKLEGEQRSGTRAGERMGAGL